MIEKVRDPDYNPRDDDPEYKEKKKRPGSVNNFINNVKNFMN